MELRSEIKTLLPLYRLLPFIVLFEGFVSIAIEILTIRQLLPVAGGSVIVTSLIIGIFLLFLALGYQRGGKLHANPPKILQRNFFIAAIWLGVGLSYIFIGLFFYSIEKIMGSSIVYPLIAYLLLIIAPLIYILGQTVPITMNMVKQNQSAGMIGGNTLSLSTLGSFLGATVTTLILMYYLGVAWTVFINCLLLMSLALVLSDNKHHLFLQFAIAFVFIWIVYSVNIRLENNFFILTNNYANYQILDNTQKGEKILIINDALSSSINKQKKAFPYAETIKKILFNDMKLRHENILVLGAGGFTLSAENTYQNHFTYVDIDPQIKKVTVPRFIPSLDSTLIADDARHFLKSTDKHYQVIVSDAYSDIKAIPSHLITREYMNSIKQRLTKDGIAIFNIIANPMLADAYSKHIDNTIRNVFQNCMVIPQIYANKRTNILYTCSNNTNQLDKVVYSDNLNNSTMDAFNWK